MELARTRNLGLMAHMDAGKTTATERMLALADVVSAVGASAPGASAPDASVPGAEDFLTITSAATSCSWRGHTLNIIDTPGQVDFTLDVERALRVLDGAVALFSGVSGVEAQTETFWRQADQYDVPRIAFVNKLDRDGADFDHVVQMISLRLDATLLPLQIPLHRDGELVGLIDLVDMRAVHFGADGGSVVGPISDDLQGLARERREALLDTLVEFDDEIGDLVVATGEVPTELLKRSIRNATLRFGVVPVLGGSAFSGCGVAELLDAVVDYLPSPLEVSPVVGYLPGSPDEAVSRTADAEAPLAALSFRVVNDRENGPLNFVRIYSGVLERGSIVLNPKSGRLETVRDLTKVLSTRRVSVERAGAGDIVGVGGLTATVVGDTLCDPQAPVVLESLDVPPVVVATRVTVEGSDAERLDVAVDALAKQDPSLRYRALPQAGVVDLEGVSDTHLDIVVARLRREFGLVLSAEQSRVAYREAPLRSVDVRVRESAALLALALEPADRGDGVRIENRLPGTDAAQFLRLEGALRAAIDVGGLHGYPLIDVVVGVAETLLPADVGADALERLAGRAIEQALREAGTVVLEPVMRVEVVSPEEHLGNVLSEVTGMRGNVKRIESRGSIRALTAYVPLSELGGYTETLRRVSEGQANFSMQFAYYERRPTEFADALEAMNQ